MYINPEKTKVKNTVCVNKESEECDEDFNSYWAGSDESDSDCDEVVLLPFPGKQGSTNKSSVIQENIDITMDYATMVRCMESKNSDLVNAETMAARQFISSLVPDGKTQSRLSTLTDLQIKILLPCIYVEASHKFNPLTAYNQKDMGEGDSGIDDNVAMLSGYGIFMKALNSISGMGGKSNKVECLLSSFKELVRVMLNVQLDESSLCHHDSHYVTHVSDVYDGDVLHKLLTEKMYSLNIKTLSYGHHLDMLPMDSSYRKSSEYFLINGLHDKGEARILDVMRGIFESYIEALEIDNIEKVFQITTDFQYLHLLPNANGRISQILRDCAAIYKGQLPFSALTECSHYRYLHHPVSKEHIEFMQALTEDILCAIENKTLTMGICKKDPYDILMKYEGNPFIHQDILSFKNKQNTYGGSAR